MQWECPERKKQSDKGHSDQNDPYRVQHVPSPSLRFPILWKVRRIPCFDSIIDRYRTDDAEHDNKDPENHGINEKHGVASRPLPCQPKQKKMEKQRCCHPDWHNLTKEPCKNLNGGQKRSMIVASQGRMDKNPDRKLVAE
jgi:hypothetical protein